MFFLKKKKCNQICPVLGCGNGRHDFHLCVKANFITKMNNGSTSTD